VAERGERTVAAIASRRAGELQGLAVAAEHIQMRADNTTRFWSISSAPHPGCVHRGAIVFRAANRPGSLAACLQVFSLLQLNLTRLESRPTRETRWEYSFWADFDAPGGEQLDLGLLTSLLSRCTSSLRLLGAWPAT
jgi:prephenate dehydratase